MRYHSLRLVSSFYKLSGIVGGLLVIILFVAFLVGALGLVEQIASRQGIRPSLEAYLAAITPPIYFLIAGLIGSLTSFAFGAFIMLMIDIEQGVRNIDFHFNNREQFPDDYDPVTPQPWTKPVSDSMFKPPRGSRDLRP